MTDEQLEAGDFTLDKTKRTVRGLLMPWGEKSRPSNVAPIAFDRGTLAVPADVSVMNANRRHDRYDPVARFASVEDTDRGLVAQFSIAEGAEGDEFIKEYETGKLTKLSAEVRDIVRDGAKAISAKLTGAAFVSDGAFASAALFAVDPAAVPSPEAVDGGEDVVEKSTEEVTGPDGKTHKQTTTKTTHVEGGVTTITTTVEIEAPEPDPASPEKEGGPVTVPNTVEQQKADFAARPVTRAEALGTLAAMRAGNADAKAIERLNGTTVAGEHAMFALNDVKYDGANSVQPDERRPLWIGEFWKGVTYQQKVLPLFAHADLTSKKVAGFRWTTQPAGGDWAGNKSNIPSNQPATAPDEAIASFFAGGHDHAIEHQIFDTPGYFESYFAAMVESYAKWADGKATEAALAAATTLAADNPAGLAIGVGWSALIDALTAVVDADAIPTFALVNSTLWKSMLKVPADNILGYLAAALKIDEGELAGFSIRPLKPSVLGTSILAGAREAMTVYELPGEPIRVTAPDMVKGGIDTNVIGAEANMVHKADALVEVTPYVAS